MGRYSLAERYIYRLMDDAYRQMSDIFQLRAGQGHPSRGAAHFICGQLSSPEGRNTLSNGEALYVSQWGHLPSTEGAYEIAAARIMLKEARIGGAASVVGGAIPVSV